MFQMIMICFWIMSFVMVSGVEAKVSKKGTKPESPENAQPVEMPSAPKEKKYVYSPAGKTDPFESFLKTKSGVRGTNLSATRDVAMDDAEAIISRGEPETELERIELSKLKLTSIIKSQNQTWAMVVDPKGRGYFLEKGTKIGMESGFVDEIISDQKQTDFGMESIKKVVIKIPYRDRNRNIIYRSIEMEMSQAAM